MRDMHRSLTAADKLDEMSTEIAKIAADIREHYEDLDYCYAVVYHFRTRLGKVVASLGFGIPRKGQLK